MGDKQRLQDAFKYVRKTFFPRWDKNNQWSVRIVHDLPIEGRCEKGIKTVSLQYVSGDEDKLHLLLIHEICHSSASGHSKKWSSRMLKAATRAEKAGCSNVADLIRKNVAETEKAASVNASLVYDCIRSRLILGDKLDESYEDFINSVACGVGMYPDELEKKFKQCRKIYNKGYRFRQLKRRSINVNYED